MEYIQDEEFYHVQRNKFYNPYPLWEEGKTYFCGKEKNPYIKVFDEFSANNQQTQEALTGAVEHYQNIIREIAFEEVRKEFFPNLPSRQRCLWVIPNEEESIDYWWQQLQSEAEQRLLKLKLTGKIHEVSQSYIKLNYGSLDYHRYQAFKYWNGNKVKNAINDKEVLFEGFAEVIEVVDLQSFRNN